MEERINKLATAFVSGMKEPEIEALGVLLLEGFDNGRGISALFDEMLKALENLRESLIKQLEDIEECPDCNGDTTCKTCKGVGKFIPELPNFAIALNAEIDLVRDIEAGKVWAKHKELEVDFSRALTSCRE